MAERVSSENPSVSTVTGTVGRYGGTRRPEVRVPASDASAFPVGEVVRLVLDGAEYRARIEEASGGERAFRGAYESPRLARTPGEDENRLAEWVESADLDIGRSVHVDVVEPEYVYGVRAPGETAYYDAVEKPSDSLASIARDLDG